MKKIIGINIDFSGGCYVEHKHRTMEGEPTDKIRFAT